MIYGHFHLCCYSSRNSAYVLQSVVRKCLAWANRGSIGTDLSPEEIKRKIWKSYSDGRRNEWWTIIIILMMYHLSISKMIRDTVCASIFKEVRPWTVKSALSICLKIILYWYFIKWIPADFMSVVVTLFFKLFKHHVVINSVIINQIHLLYWN